VDEETLFMIARQSTGALRDAISLLDQLTSTGDVITLKVAQQVLGTATNQTVINLVDMICQQDTKGCLDQLHQALDSGTDPRQFARQMVDYVRGLMLIQLGDERSIDVTDEVRQTMGEQTQTIAMHQLTELVKLFNTAANESRLAWQPSLALELAIAQGVHLFEEQSSAHVSFIEKPIIEPKLINQSTIKEKPDNKQKEHSTIKKSEEKSELEKVFEGTGENKEETNSSSQAETSDKSTPTYGINEVREALNEVKTLIRGYRKNTEALLASARSFSMKNGMVIIGFQSPVLKERMEKGDHQEIIQRAFSHVLGTEVRVRAVVINAKSNLVEHEDEFEPNSLVSAALDLGGKIVDKE